MDFEKSVIIFIGVVLLFAILKLLSNLLIPLVLALFFVMLLEPLLGFLNRKKFPNWLSVTLISILTLGILMGFLSIISSTATQVADNGAELMDKVNSRIDMVIEWVNGLVGAKLYSYEVKQNITQSLNGDRITEMLGSIAVFLGSFTGSFFIFALYFIILLSGFSKYREYIMFVFGKRKGKPFLENFESIMKSISSYVGVKFLVSSITGVLFYVICQVFGIQFALFWGFLAFVLNFIPSIGSIIATIPPLLMGLIYLDFGLGMALYGILLIMVQTIVGNILDPILMGNRMKLNTLTIILGLLFWGYIWGAAGMLLSVPLMVMMRIIFEHNPDSEMIARAMSSTKQNPITSKED